MYSEQDIKYLVVHVATLIKANANVDVYNWMKTLPEEVRSKIGSLVLNDRFWVEMTNMNSRMCESLNSDVGNQRW